MKYLTPRLFMVRVASPYKICDTNFICRVLSKGRNDYIISRTMEAHQPCSRQPLANLSERETGGFVTAVDVLR